LIRDENGRCIVAFTLNIGCCSITRVELRGAISGLRLAWEAWLRRIELQVDSKAIIQLIEAEEEPQHQHAMIVLDFRDYLSRNWEVRLRHIYREANHATDFLASIGNHYPLGQHLVPTSNVNLCYFLRYDYHGVSEPRSILFND
ncbi:Putative ribonuclease H protein At1g65750, partial [Linum perenne]